MTRLILATSLALLFITPPALAAPKVSAPKASVDFGNLFQGEKASHTFTFQNAGDAPLLIDKVRSSCGCTAVMVSRKELQPGEQGEIKTTFDSTRFRGPIEKKVYLYSNDPQQPTLKFTLRATVKEILEPRPHRISAGPLTAEAAHVETVDITNQWTGALQITRVTSTLENLETTMEPATLQPGEKGRLTLTFTPAKEQRRVNSHVVLHTDNALLPEIRIPLFYLVKVGG